MDECVSRLLVGRNKGAGVHSVTQCTSSTGRQKEYSVHSVRVRVGVCSVTRGPLVAPTQTVLQLYAELRGSIRNRTQVGYWEAISKPTAIVPTTLWATAST